MNKQNKQDEHEPIERIKMNTEQTLQIEKNPLDSRDTYFRLGRRLIVTTEQNGHFASRLYVNGGETATTLCAKHKTFNGAENWALNILFT
jgi:hypothetical protein